MLGLASWIGGALLLDQYGARKLVPRHRQWDAIVVAGCPLGGGGEPGVALKARVVLALELWREGLAPLVFFTGGSRRGDDGLEARGAARYAEALGLPASAIALEDRSRTTTENAREAARLLGRIRVVVVTDSYHALRCEQIFGRYFGEVCVAGCRSPLRSRARGAVREVFAIVHHLLLGGP